MSERRVANYSWGVVESLGNQRYGGFVLGEERWSAEGQGAAPEKKMRSVRKKGGGILRGRLSVRSEVALE